MTHKVFIPYPDIIRVGESGIAPVRVLMKDGVWQGELQWRPGLRPLPPPPPKDWTYAEKYVDKALDPLKGMRMGLVL